VTEFDGQPGRPTPQLPALTREQGRAHEHDLHAGLIGLTGMVLGALTVDELLTKVAGFAADVIPDVDGASATVAHQSWALSRIQAWAATAKFVDEIDTFQYEVCNEGPCITSMRSRRPCISGLIGTDTRWPRFAAETARFGVNSALSLPLMVGEQVIGAINAYAYQPDAFAEHAVMMGTKFAEPAAVSVHNARLLMEARHLAEQLQRTLTSRSVIDQAVGILRSRSGASAEDAFGEMVKVSQSTNTQLHVLAERLVDESVRRARARQEQA
jgi:GAF domain-containing protein